ncbi:MAG: 50S ribosomal protein L11 methyltransferase [Nitrospirae bacterium]|nr:50S ribosomal protein L11 methyltransferase [Nitrospirota bacterium]
MKAAQVCYRKLLITVDSKLIEHISAVLFDCGTLGIEEREDGLISYFPGSTTIEQINAAMDNAKGILNGLGLSSEFTFTIEDLPHTDWTTEWKKGLNPIEAGDKLVILAPWHEYSGDRLRIVIEPAMAFGTGHHATTLMCLEEIEAAALNTKDSLLDIGTGTGILAIAAARLGFTQVIAIDNDPVAVETARENVELNNAARVEVVQNTSNDLNIAPRARGFDTIVCNLTSETIKNLLDKILEAAAPNGTIILSGILKEQEAEIFHYLSLRNIKYVRVKNIGDWVCLSFTPGNCTPLRVAVS